MEPYKIMTRYLWKEDGHPSMETLVSVSQIQTFMSCPKKWGYGYIEGLTPRIERPYLNIGRLCHKGMQVAMGAMWKDQQEGVDTPREAEWLKAGLNAMDQMWEEYMNGIEYLPEEYTDLNQILVDAKKVFQQAYGEFKPTDYTVVGLKVKGGEIPALELHFIIPCQGAAGLHGFIDAILQEKASGKVWCVDYKFRKSFTLDEDEENNTQNAVYAMACTKLGIPITGTMTWQHLNTPAVDPTMLKTGKVSRAKIKTTWEQYARFCAEHGQDPEEYREEMEPKLADIEWYRATYELRNVCTIENMWESSMEPTARAIRAGRRGKFLPRNMYPWNCKMCQYRSLCQGELRGYDADYIRATEYSKR